MAEFETKLRADDNTFKELFVRYNYNPILTARDWPYPVNTVFNPAATIYEGKTLLLARVEDRRGFSHLTKAVSEDGIDNWVIDRHPTLCPDPDNHPEEKWGIEDPRITYIDELGKYAVVYTAYSESGPTVSLALTRDFVTFERMGPIMPPEDKDAALFPRRFGGKWLLIHRPIEHGAHIWISSSENLKYWGDHKILIDTRGGAWWDGSKVGLSTPPLETPASLMDPPTIMTTIGSTCPSQLVDILTWTFASGLPAGWGVEGWIIEGTQTGNPFNGTRLSSNASQPFQTTRLHNVRSAVGTQYQRTYGLRLVNSHGIVVDEDTNGRADGYDICPT